MEFHNILRNLRMNNEMTQEELAAKLGVSAATVSQYEQKRREPNNDTIIKLSSIFDVSVDFLLGIEGSQYGVRYDDFTYAMYNATKNFTPEQKKALLNMAKALKETK